MTDLQIDERAPPTVVTQEARAIAAQGVASRVKIEPDGSNGWRVIADGRVSMGKGAPVDIPSEEWDDERSKSLGKSDFDEFVEDVKSRSENRKHITPNHKRADAKGFWKITVNYEDPRHDKTDN